MTACNGFRGHWGLGTTPLCACPTPADSPAARIGNEGDALRFEALHARFVDRSITEAELDEYAALWNRAFPTFRPWLRRTPVAA